MYEWIGRGGPERFVITPLEFVPRAYATLAENYWMRAWGLGKLKNRSLPPGDSQKGAFFAQRKQWKRELEELGGSMTGLPKTIVTSKVQMHESLHPPALLLNMISAPQNSPVQSKEPMSVLFECDITLAPCACASWDARVSIALPRLHGHVLARELKHMAACMHTFDAAVFNQNMKNAVVPP